MGAVKIIWRIKRRNKAAALIECERERKESRSPSAYIWNGVSSGLARLIVTVGCVQMDDSKNGRRAAVGGGPQIGRNPACLI